jgi:hypothetical protein
LIHHVIVTGEAVDIHFILPFATTPQAARRLPKAPEGTPGHFYRLRLAHFNRCSGSISYTARRDNTGLRGRTFCDNNHPHRRTFRDNGRTLCDNSAITTSSGTASPIMAGLQGQAGSPEFLLEFLHTSCGQTPPE